MLNKQQQCFFRFLLLIRPECPCESCHYRNLWFCSFTTARAALIGEETTPSDQSESSSQHHCGVTRMNVSYGKPKLISRTDALAARHAASQLWIWDYFAFRLPYSPSAECDMFISAAVVRKLLFFFAELQEIHYICSRWVCRWCVCV